MHHKIPCLPLLKKEVIGRHSIDCRFLLLILLLFHSGLGNPLTRFRESPYQLSKLVRGIPYLLHTKTAEEKQNRELEKFFAKLF